LLVEAFQSPPALSQSALLVIFERSEAPLGLAEGELDEPLDDPDAPGVVVPLPDVPGLLLPGAEGLVPLPLLVWAAARVGASARNATTSTTMSFCIVTSSLVYLGLG
jgi:hypothetical protein